MAIIPVVTTDLTLGVLFQWIDMAPGDFGEPVELAGFGNRTLQIRMVPGIGNLALQFSNDPDISWGGSDTWNPGPGMDMINPGYKRTPQMSAPYPDARFFRPAFTSNNPAALVVATLWCIKG